MNGTPSGTQAVDQVQIAGSVLAHQRAARRRRAPRSPTSAWPVRRIGQNARLTSSRRHCATRRSRPAARLTTTTRDAERRCGTRHRAPCSRRGTSTSGVEPPRRRARRRATAPIPIVWSPPGIELVELAADPRERAVEHRDAVVRPVCGDVRRTSRVLALARRSGGRACSWPAASTLTPKRSRVADLGERARAVVEADEHEHRVERQARDRVGGHALGALGVSTVTTATPVAKCAHDGAEAIGLDALDEAMVGDEGSRHGAPGDCSVCSPPSCALASRSPRCPLVAVGRRPPAAQEGIELAEGEPELRGRGALQRALLRLPHADARPAPRARRSSPTDARVQGRPELQLSARSSTTTSSTRSATAASPPARCRRTSSSARTPRRSRDFVAKYSGRATRKTPRHARSAADARPQGDPPRPGRRCAPRSRAGGDGSDERLDAALELDERRRELLPEVEGLRARAERGVAGDRRAPRRRAATPPRRSPRCRRSRARGEGAREELAGGRGRARRRAGARCPTRPIPTRRRRGHGRCARSASARAARRATTSSWPAPLIDMEAGARVSGLALRLPQGRPRAARAGAGALGARACCGGHGFEPVIPPVLVREEALYGTGFLPDTEQQIYRLRRRRPLPGRARARCRSRRCTRARSSTTPRCRCATRASRPASGARRAPPGATRAGSSASTSSTRSRCSAFVEPEDGGRRARAAAGDRGGDPAGARDPLPRGQHRRRRPRRLGGQEVRLRGVDARARSATAR